MKVYYDFHIHSGLSPCADDGNTPADIVGMAKLKGLDAIAVTDHNAAGNCAAAMAHGERAGILVLPGMELTTAEDVHVLCLFARLSDALCFERRIREGMLRIDNRPEVFGNQLFYGYDDEIIGSEGQLLHVASDIYSHTAAEVVKSFGGVAIPAHVCREGSGMLSALGGIPLDFGYGCLEEGRCPGHKLEALRALGYGFVKNSDAHTLGDISERENFIELAELSADAVIAHFLAKQP